MLPPAIFTILTTAVNAKTATEIFQYVPTIVAYLKKQDLERPSWTEADKELVERFYVHYSNLIVSGNKSLIESGIKFEELAHKQKLELMDKLDISTLESSHKAEVAIAEIESGRKSAFWQTALGAGTFLLTALAALDSYEKKQKLDYKRTRPRSISEKVFGDKDL